MDVLPTFCVLLDAIVATLIVEVGLAAMIDFCLATYAQALYIHILS